MTTELGPLPRWRLLAVIWFWSLVVLETLARRRFSRVMERRLRGLAVVSSDAGVVPPQGGVVFAANHYYAGLTLDVVAAVLSSAACARPAVAEQCTIIVGHRASSLPLSPWRRVVRWMAARFFARWEQNVLRIPTGRAATGIAHLRTWRRRAAHGPTLVFPEGVAHGVLRGVREGAGRWLATLGVPVIPVGVWWGLGRWNVAFGAPVVWSGRAELRDLQLGLAMAALLPSPLAPEWTGALEKWRSAHASKAA